jgi:nitroreductase
MEPDDVLHLMKDRRSIRAYTADPVPDEAIEMILEAGRWCQSASNKQPWRFIVIKDATLIQTLAKAATYGNFVKDAQVLIAIVANKKVAPKWYIHDTSMASHQMCLMAWALGIGTCWIGAMSRDKAAALLGLSKDELLTTILPLGYPETIPPPTSRKDLASLVTYK